MNAGVADARPLILCADDFGYHEGVDEGILRLVEMKRLTAVGCLITGQTVRASAPRLGRHKEVADIGLHFALTELPAALAAHVSSRRPKLYSLMGSAFLGTLDQAAIVEEIRCQIALFRDLFGFAPAFIDGHQHVHLLPTVCDAIHSLFSDGRLDPKQTALRDCFEPPAAILKRQECVAKATVVSLLAWRNHVKARQQGLATNDSFRGIYDFGTDRPYRDRFLHFLTGDGARPLVMCHPAASVSRMSFPDPIIAARLAEFSYIAGGNFEQDISAAGLTLSRFH